jgi:hypothetical protein
MFVEIHKRKKDINTYVHILPPHVLYSALEAEWRWLIHDMRTRLLPPHMLYSAIEADVCSTYADVCWRMLTYADVCCCMLTYADVCSRMLTYADVCSHMLTYAHVCLAFTEPSRYLC